MCPRSYLCNWGCINIIKVVVIINVSHLWFINNRFKVICLWFVIINIALSSKRLTSLLSYSLHLKIDYSHAYPIYRPVSQLACSSTGQKLSCPGTHGLRHGSHGRNCQDLWPPVLQPSGSWWERQNWWVSVPIFSLWTLLMPVPALTDVGNISSLPSQLSLSTTIWVRKTRPDLVASFLQGCRTVLIKVHSHQMFCVRPCLVAWPPWVHCVFALMVHWKDYFFSVKIVFYLFWRSNECWPFQCTHFKIMLILIMFCINV